MAQITTMKNSKTNEILYPKTIKSALMNDDGTPLTFSDSGSGLYGDPVSEFENFDPINAQYLGGNAPGYYASQAGVDSAIGQIANEKTIDLRVVNLLSYIDINAGYPQMHHFRVIPSSTLNGAPELSWGVGYYAIQTALDAFCVYIGQINNFINRKVSGSWIGWKEIATTEKISFVCTPKAGFVISRQENYRIGNVVYFALSINKTDNSTFAGNTFLEVASIPSGFSNSNANIGSAFGFSAGGVYTGVSYFSNGAIQILVSGATCTTVRASGVVAL